MPPLPPPFWFAAHVAIVPGARNGGQKSDGRRVPCPRLGVGMWSIRETFREHIDRDRQSLSPGVFCSHIKQNVSRRDRTKLWARRPKASLCSERAVRRKVRYPHRTSNDSAAGDRVSTGVETDFGISHAAMTSDSAWPARADCCRRQSACFSEHSRHTLTVLQLELAHAEN